MKRRNTSWGVSVSLNLEAVVKRMRRPHPSAVSFSGGHLAMSRSNTGVARRPATTQSHLQKRMRKNAVLKNLTTKSEPPKSVTKHH